MEDDELGTLLIGCAIQVHRALGPGLLESVYETCLYHELSKTGIEVKRQSAVPFTYDGVQFDDGFRIDILLGNRLIVEVKATEKILPIHSARLLTYLKLTELRIGYILNFNVAQMRQGGIKRLVWMPRSSKHAWLDALRTFACRILERFGRSRTRLPKNAGGASK